MNKIRFIWLLCVKPDTFSSDQCLTLIQDKSRTTGHRMSGKVAEGQGPWLAWELLEKACQNGRPVEVPSGCLTDTQAPTQQPG